MTGGEMMPGDAGNGPHSEQSEEAAVAVSLKPANRRSRFFGWRAALE